MGKYTYEYLENHAYWQRLKEEEKPERYRVPGPATYRLFVGDEPTETYRMLMGTIDTSSNKVLT